MAITEYETKFKRQIKGVCTGWIKRMDLSNEDMAEEDVVAPVWLKKGTMHFFSDGRPLIMVGPGTGVAAFRSVIQERASKQKLVLIFGCRSEADDYYYKDEWEKMQADSVDLNVICAFSRETPDAGKVYVQHKIRENGEDLASLILDDNAAIYVSGRAKFMPQSVEKAFA